jgi:hypothetical protein
MPMFLARSTAPGCWPSVISLLVISRALVWYLIMPSRKIRCPSREFAKSNRCISFSSSMPSRPPRCVPPQLTTAHRLEPTDHGVDLRQLRVLDVAGRGGHLRMDPAFGEQQVTHRDGLVMVRKHQLDEHDVGVIEGAGAGNGRALAEPYTIGIPDVPLWFAQPARTTMAAAAEIRLVLRSSFHTSLKSSMECCDAHGSGPRFRRLPRANDSGVLGELVDVAVRCTEMDPSVTAVVELRL